MHTQSRKLAFITHESLSIFSYDVGGGGVKEGGEREGNTIKNSFICKRIHKSRLKKVSKTHTYARGYINVDLYFLPLIAFNFLAAIINTFYNKSQIVCQYFSYSANLQIFNNSSFSMCILSVTVRFNMSVERFGTFLYLLAKINCFTVRINMF